MNSVEKRHSSRRSGGHRKHSDTSSGGSFLDETDREVSNLTDRAFRSLCIGDEAVYNDSDLSASSPSTRTERQQAFCQSGQDWNREEMTMAAQDSYGLQLQRYGQEWVRGAETQGDPRRAGNVDGRTGGRMSATFQHAFMDGSLHQRSLNKEPLSLLSNGATEFGTQERRSRSRVSSLIKAFNSDGCRDGADNKLKEWNNEANWDKSALMSIQRELSEFSTAYGQKVNSGPFSPTGLFSSQESFYSSQVATAHMDSSSSSSFMRSSHSHHSMSSLYSSSSNVFIHSEYSPFRVWRAHDRFPFQHGDVAGYMHGSDFQKWYETPMYKELSLGPETHHVPMQEPWDSEPPPRSSSTSTVLHKASAVQKRCESELAEFHNMRKRTQSLGSNKLPSQRPSTVSPTNEVSRRGRDTTLNSINDLQQKFKMMTSEHSVTAEMMGNPHGVLHRNDSLIQFTNSNTAAIMAGEQVVGGNTCTTPFNVSQLHTPGSYSHQDVRTSEVHQCALSPPAMEHPPVRAESRGATPDIRLSSYKARATSLFFNLKDNRKRVKSTYSPPKFKGLENFDRNKQVIRNDGIEPRDTVINIPEFQDSDLQGPQVVEVQQGPIVDPHTTSHHPLTGYHSPGVTAFNPHLTAAYGVQRNDYISGDYLAPPTQSEMFLHTGFNSYSQDKYTSSPLAHGHIQQQEDVSSFANNMHANNMNKTRTLVGHAYRQENANNLSISNTVNMAQPGTTSSETDVPRLHVDYTNQTAYPINMATAMQSFNESMRGEMTHVNRYEQVKDNKYAFTDRSSEDSWKHRCQDKETLCLNDKSNPQWQREVPVLTEKDPNAQFFQRMDMLTDMSRSPPHENGSSKDWNMRSTKAQDHLELDESKAEGFPVVFHTPYHTSVNPNLSNQPNQVQKYSVCSTQYVPGGTAANEKQLPSMQEYGLHIQQHGIKENQSTQKYPKIKSTEQEHAKQKSYGHDGHDNYMFTQEPTQIQPDVQVLQEDNRLRYQQDGVNKSELSLKEQTLRADETQSRAILTNQDKQYVNVKEKIVPDRKMKEKQQIQLSKELERAQTLQTKLESVSAALMEEMVPRRAAEQLKHPTTEGMSVSGQTITDKLAAEQSQDVHIKEDRPVRAQQAEEDPGERTAVGLTERSTAGEAEVELASKECIEPIGISPDGNAWREPGAQQAKEGQKQAQQIPAEVIKMKPSEQVEIDPGVPVEHIKAQLSKTGTENAKLPKMEETKAVHSKVEDERLRAEDEDEEKGRDELLRAEDEDDVKEKGRDERLRAEQIDADPSEVEKVSDPFRTKQAQVEKAKEQLNEVVTAREEQTNTEQAVEPAPATIEHNTEQAQAVEPAPATIEHNTEQAVEPAPATIEHSTEQAQTAEPAPATIEHNTEQAVEPAPATIEHVKTEHAKAKQEQAKATSEKRMEHSVASLLIRKAEKQKLKQEPDRVEKVKMELAKAKAELAKIKEKMREEQKQKQSNTSVSKVVDRNVLQKEEQPPPHHVSHPVLQKEEQPPPHHVSHPVLQKEEQPPPHHVSHPVIQKEEQPPPHHVSHPVIQKEEQPPPYHVSHPVLQREEQPPPHHVTPVRVPVGEFEHLREKYGFSKTTLTNRNPASGYDVASPSQDIERSPPHSEEGEEASDNNKPRDEEHSQSKAASSVKDEEVRENQYVYSESSKEFKLSNPNDSSSSLVTKQTDSEKHIDSNTKDKVMNAKPDPVRANADLSQPGVSNMNPTKSLTHERKPNPNKDTHSTPSRTLTHKERTQTKQEILTSRIKAHAQKEISAIKEKHFASGKSVQQRLPSQEVTKTLDRNVPSSIAPRDQHGTVQVRTSVPNIVATPPVMCTNATTSLLDSQLQKQEPFKSVKDTIIHQPMELNQTKYNNRNEELKQREKRSGTTATSQISLRKEEVMKVNSIHSIQAAEDINAPQKTKAEPPPSKPEESSQRETRQTSDVATWETQERPEDAPSIKLVLGQNQAPAAADDDSLQIMGIMVTVRARTGTVSIHEDGGAKKETPEKAKIGSQTNDNIKLSAKLGLETTTEHIALDIPNGGAEERKLLVLTSQPTVRVEHTEVSQPTVRVEHTEVSQPTVRVEHTDVSQPTVRVEHTEVSQPTVRGEPTEVGAKNHLENEPEESTDRLENKTADLTDKRLTTQKESSLMRKTSHSHAVLQEDPVADKEDSSMVMKPAPSKAGKTQPILFKQGKITEKAKIYTNTNGNEAKSSVKVNHVTSTKTGQVRDGGSVPLLVDKRTHPSLPEVDLKGHEHVHISIGKQGARTPSGDNSEYEGSVHIGCIAIRVVPEVMKQDNQEKTAKELLALRSLAETMNTERDKDRAIPLTPAIKPLKQINENIVQHMAHDAFSSGSRNQSSRITDTSETTRDEVETHQQSNITEATADDANNTRIQATEEEYFQFQGVIEINQEQNSARLYGAGMQSLPKEHTEELGVRRTSAGGDATSLHSDKVSVNTELSSQQEAKQVTNEDKILDNARKTTLESDSATSENMSKSEQDSKNSRLFPERRSDQASRSTFHASGKDRPSVMDSYTTRNSASKEQPNYKQEAKSKPRVSTIPEISAIADYARLKVIAADDGPETIQEFPPNKKEGFFPMIQSRHSRRPVFTAETPEPRTVSKKTKEPELNHKINKEPKCFVFSTVEQDHKRTGMFKLREKENVLSDVKAKEDKVDAKQIQTQDPTVTSQAITVDVTSQDTATVAGPTLISSANINQTNTSCSQYLDQPNNSTTTERPEGGEVFTKQKAVPQKENNSHHQQAMFGKMREQKRDGRSNATNQNQTKENEEEVAAKQRQENTIIQQINEERRAALESQKREERRAGEREARAARIEEGRREKQREAEKMAEDERTVRLAKEKTAQEEFEKKRLEMEEKRSADEEKRKKRREEEEERRKKETEERIAAQIQEEMRRAKQREEERRVREEERHVREEEEERRVREEERRVREEEAELEDRRAAQIQEDRRVAQIQEDRREREEHEERARREEERRRAKHREIEQRIKEHEEMRAAEQEEERRKIQQEETPRPEGPGERREGHQLPAPIETDRTLRKVEHEEQQPSQRVEIEGEQPSQKAEQRKASLMMDALQYYAITSSANSKDKHPRSPVSPRRRLEPTKQESTLDDSLSRPYAPSSPAPAPPRSTTSSPAPGPKPTMFRVKDNTFRASPLTKSVKPRLHKSFGEDFRVGSPQGDWRGSNRAEEEQDRARRSAGTPIHQDTRSNRLPSVKESPPPQPQPLSFVPEPPAARAEYRPYSRRSVAPDEEDSRSCVSNVSEDVESFATSSGDLADFRGFCDYDRPESTCSFSSDASRSLGKPPSVPPKSDKALRRAQRLATRRIKKELTRTSEEGPDPEENRLHAASSSSSSSASELRSSYRHARASPHFSAPFSLTHAPASASNVPSSRAEMPSAYRYSHASPHAIGSVTSPHAGGPVSLPVTSPHAPVTSPHAPITSPHAPITSPHVTAPVTSPHAPITSPHAPVTSPHATAPVTSPHVTSPHRALPASLPVAPKTKASTPSSPVLRRRANLTGPVKQYHVEPGYAQSYPLTQPKVLQDPGSGQYYVVDMPVQVKTKTFFDPETGKYIQLNVRQSAQPQHAGYPRTAQPHVQSPPRVYPQVATPGKPFVVYPGYPPGQQSMSVSTLPPQRSYSGMSILETLPQPPRSARESQNYGRHGYNSEETPYMDTAYKTDTIYDTNKINHRTDGVYEKHPEGATNSRAQGGSLVYGNDASAQSSLQQRDIITMSELEDFMDVSDW